jgi:hypothetical protein
VPANVARGSFASPGPTVSAIALPLRTKSGRRLGSRGRGVVTCSSRGVHAVVTDQSLLSCHDRKHEGRRKQDTRITV